MAPSPLQDVQRGRETGGVNAGGREWTAAGVQIAGGSRGPGVERIEALSHPVQAA